MILSCSASAGSSCTDLLSGMFPMDFAYIPHILTPLFYTIQMSVTGTVIGFSTGLYPGTCMCRFHGFSKMDPLCSPFSHTNPAVFPSTDPCSLCHLSLRSWGLCRHLCHHLVYLCHYDPAYLSGYGSCLSIGLSGTSNHGSVSFPSTHPRAFPGNSPLFFSPTHYICWKPMCVTVLFLVICRRRRNWSSSETKKYPGWSMKK